MDKQSGDKSQSIVIPSNDGPIKLGNYKTDFKPMILQETNWNLSDIMTYFPTMTDVTNWRQRRCEVQKTNL